MSGEVKADYNLRADVKTVLDTTSITDPGEIADKVAESVPAKELRAALRVTLRAYVRYMMAQSRTNNPPLFSGSGQSRNDSHAPTAAAGRSWKRDGIRDGWQRQLTARYHVGDRQWKQLREMTHADLMAAAGEREATARRTEAWARILHAWAGLLTEHDAATFGALPVEVQMYALGGTA